MIRFLGPAWCLLAGAASPLFAQSAPPATIDTIVVLTENVFGAAEARSSVLFRIANGLRFTTRSSVVRRELLFEQGQPLDSALVEESARNLRALGVFRQVVIDTTRLGGRLAVVVRTKDGWSTQLSGTFRTTGGTVTWASSLSERNFLGRATVVGAGYRQDPDRSAVTLVAVAPRLFGSRVLGSAAYEDLSDGQLAVWRFGLPFRSLSDRSSFEFGGERADHRVLQFVVRRVNDADTVQYQRRAFLNRAVAAYAPIAETTRYLRVGGIVQVKREEYLLRRDTALAIPDTVTGAVGAFAEFRLARFTVVTHFNGFTQQEDVDLSTTIRLAAWAAPSSFGYTRSGIGPSLTVGTGVALPSGFARLSAHANGLFTSAGLDSGRVSVRATFATQLVSRQATFFHVQAGLQDSPPPGGEFDLGHFGGPRSFGPHAFTGTRSIWGTVEHRVFLFDNLLNLLGLGFAGFLDYGGAWFAGERTHVGGNVGIGLRTGASRAIGANIGRFDLGYRFGEGFSGNRWVVSIGRGFSF